MYTFFSNVEHVSAKAYHVCAKKTTCDHMFSAVHGVCVGFNALSHILEELGDVANCLTKVCCHKYPFPVLSSLDRHHTSIVCRPWLLPNIRTGKLHQHTTQNHESPRHILYPSKHKHYIPQVCSQHDLGKSSSKLLHDAPNVFGDPP